MTAASAAGMHPITFGLKRAYLRSVEINRKYTKLHRLTPARFDMLVSIADGKFGMLQYYSRRRLGVRSATVSRMLASLEKLGYLTRIKWPPDRRYRWITLTPRGRMVIDDAQDDLTLGPSGENVARAIVSTQPHRRRPTERELRKAHKLLTTVRRLAGDTAFLRYPSYLASGERSPEHPVPYPGEYPEWMAQALATARAAGSSGSSPMPGDEPSVRGRT